ncbi:MAG: RING finger domain-containing protein [Promethearchaeota archaeon]
MRTCIICYEKIEDLSDSQGCLNDHFAHTQCLKNWLLHSNKCPVCNIRYPKSVLTKFEDFIRKTMEMEEKKKEEKRMDLISSQIAAQLREEEAHSLITEKINNAKKFISEKKNTNALDILFSVLDNEAPKNSEAQFLIGKIRYLEGRFDLAISNLMKLVKIQYDFPMAFYYIGKSYENLGLDKAKWAYDRSFKNLEKLIKDPEISESNKKKYRKIIEEISNYLKKTA